MSAAASSCSDSDTTDVGWLYCFENPSMPDVYKIGITTRTPEERLAEANRSSTTWGPPTSYHIVLTRKVTRLREIERTVHSLLEELGMRVHPRREFFKVSRSIVEKVFTLIAPSDDGDVIEHVVDNDIESTITCICCHWSGPSHRFPRHALRHHKHLIYLNPTQLEHCVMCYLVMEDKKIPFTMCLACEKGTIASPFAGNGSRWVTRHNLLTSCHSIHADKVIELDFPTLE